MRFNFQDRVFEQNTRIGVARAEVMKAARKLVDAADKTELLAELNGLVRCEQLECAVLAEILKEETP